MMVINGDKAIFGRLLASSAKKLLTGEDVVVVNAEKTVFSGNKVSIIDRYRAKRNIQQKANPEHSPKYPVRPDMFLKYALKGMLPKKNATGKQELHKLKAYPPKPPQF